MNYWVIALLIAAGLGACQSAPKEPWDGKIFVGNSERGALTREQSGDIIFCHSPPVDEMICMSAEDFKNLVGQYRYFKSECQESKP